VANQRKIRSGKGGQPVISEGLTKEKIRSKGGQPFISISEGLTKEKIRSGRGGQPFI
jgi:hypothetical protein